MEYLLILVKSLMTDTATALNKHYSQHTAGIPGAKLVFLLCINGFASIFQFALAGGAISLDKLTLLFAAIYGINCALSAHVRLVAYEKTTLVYQMLFTGAGALLIPFAYDLLQGIQFGAGKILSVILRLITVLIPLLFARQKFRNLPICLLLFLFGGLGTVILRLLTQFCGVSAGYSFCFWTNFLTLPLVVLLAIRQRGFAELKGDMRQIKPVLYLFLFLQTVLNNIGSLLNIYILSIVDTTTYSLISATMGTVITTAISVWLYKEKLTKQAVICLILSLLAIIVGAL